MVTIKLHHRDGHKETAHFQNIEKCALWMNLHYKNVNQITFMDSKTNEKIEFSSKHAFEDFYKKRVAK